MSDKTGLPWLKGKPLVTTITSVCAGAFLLFGYDQGVMSGVVISEFWLRQMGNPSTVMVGTITALYDVGAVFGAILAAITAERIGRKRALIFGCVLLIIGSVLMGAAMERIMMMFGRVFTGLGIGYITSVAPVYQSEVCKPTQRGWMLGCHLSTLLLGLLLAYWINYAFYFHPGSLQWRFPLLFQIVFAIYIIVVTSFLPDTPRWLIFHESTPDRGVLVLSKLRNKPVEHQEIQKEKDDIMYSISVESEAQGSWSDLFKDGGYSGHKRFALAVGIQFMQQTSGINIVSYYAPTIFQDILGMSQERALFVGGFLQVWYICASFLTWYLIEVVGRRRLFVSMALGMAVVLIAEAICVQNGSSSAGIAAVAFVFLFEGCFTWGWMAPSWVYPAEILPLKLRAKGTALAAAADYLGNFVVVEITPPALKNIGYKTYIIFAVFNLVTAAVCWTFYPETAGLSLEAIDTLFIKDNRSATPAASVPWYRKFQWDVIARSKILVAEARQERRLARQAGRGDVEVSELKMNEEHVEKSSSG
ncbi:hypothetical protein VTK73DRAFT_7137 [Phialemonium thermophilum]|uniref:Major facilitator superfamily (MFS) profile domain-containing protein n=1 Tax=Phialemonium thermophilum TaxID=223376 RepID=A0ABR3WGC4_9PEZI